MNKMTTRLAQSTWLMVLVLLTLSMATSVKAANFTVNTTLDTNDVAPGNGICADAAGNCSLRAAITETNQLSTSSVNRIHTITLPAGFYTLTITGAPNETLNASGDLNILNSNNLTINGANARTTIIQAGTIKSTNGTDGNGIDRVMRSFGTAVKLTLNNLTIRHGKVPTPNGGTTAAGGILYERGLSSGGALTINNCAIVDNYSPNSGSGGILSVTTTTITNSLIARNIAGGNGAGGGILFSAQNEPVTLNLINSTISGNIAGTRTGGIHISGAVSGARANITNCTITGNESHQQTPGGIYIEPGARVNIKNTLISGNTWPSGPFDINTNSVVISGGNNLIGNASTSTGWIASDLVNNTAANLGALANNGGQLDTHALLPGSAAIDAGDNCVTNASCLTFNAPLGLASDQRGFERLVNGNGALRVDIGAFEASPLNLAPNINIAPASLSFPSTVAGNLVSQQLTITNSGMADLIYSLALTGTHATEFSLNGFIPTPLPPGESVNIIISFVPSNGGSKAAALSVTSNDPDEAFTQVLLSGTGIALAPVIRVAPASLYFGNLLVGTTSTQSFSISNDGAVPLTVSMALTGTSFSLVSSSSISINPGQTASVSVRFAPLSLGQKSANIQISSNDLTNPIINFALTGGAVSQPTVGVNLTVNTKLDTNDISEGDGLCVDASGTCSLRAAISETNKLSGLAPNGTTLVHTITLPAGIYTLTITGAANEGNNASGDLNILNSSNLTINGADARTTIIQAGTIKSTNGTDGNGIDRVMKSFGTAVRLALNNLTIRHGKVPNPNPGDIAGGGIYYHRGLSTGGALTINNCAIVDNYTPTNSGGILSNTTTTINNSLIARNICGNNAFGGINFGASNDPVTLYLTNSTISGNYSISGSGLNISGVGAEAFITNCTITGNISTQTVAGVFWSSTNLVRMRNNVIAGNSAGIGGADVSNAAVISGGGNLIGSASTSTGWIASDLINNISANLGPLANNGGPTDTHALLAGSAALNTGDNCVLTNSCAIFNPGFSLTTDQRGTGFSRQVGSAVDIGAYEEAIVNTAPTVKLVALTRQQGNPPFAAQIAAVNDNETAAGDLVVTATSVAAGIMITGITNTNGAITATVAADCNAALGNNTVVLQVSDGGLTATANLIVNVTSAPVPVITTQPISVSACPGGSASISVAASNATGYQWRKDAVIIPGATNPMLALHSITQGEVGTYDVIVTGLCNTTVVSSSATLTLNTPVSIITQPVSQSVCAGTQVTFSVTAAGTGLTYQWRKGGENITGATNAVFTTSANATNAGSYDVVVSGACGTMTSTAATLTVNQATAITTQPQSQAVCENGSVSFSVTANGAGLTYQWRKGGVNVSGATTNTLTINAATAADAGSYDVMVTGACGTDISSAATLTVNSLTVISAQPVNQTACAGTSASFSVSATGTNLSYQWRKNGAAISGATGSAYTIPATAASDAGNYDVVVGGACGSVTSSVVALTVNSLTVITTQPPSKTICEGEFTNIPVFATGTGLTYQWRKNGVNIAGAITSILQITAGSLADAGNYDVVVTGACGVVTSNVASLTVNPRTAITAQPVSQTVCAGTATNLSVSATGSALTYQWRKDGVNVSGATASTLVIAAASMMEAGSYDVIVTGACGVPVISNSATLTVNRQTFIATNPVSQTFCAGAAVSLSVSATGSALTYQWRKGGVVIAGATTDSLNIAAVTTSDAGSYDVVVTGACGTLTSTAANLTAQAATAIAMQPSSLSVNAGQSATFSVNATGANLSYQWRKNGAAISGAMANTYTIATTALTDAGNYDVIVSGACGNVTSNAATLTVNSVCGTPVVSLPALSGGGIYPIGTPINFIGSFTDTGGKPHTATWNFTSNLVNVNQPGVVNVTTSTVFTNYNFTQAGVYQVALTVTNDCGNSGSANTIGVDQLAALVVIYDPGAGYVTGHGWITSPLGAYVPNPALTGKANFGFVSKYKNGNNVPEGNTEFQFKAGNLNFKSTAYEWLVIAGARAQFKGTGTINNAGAYRFILTAIDGQENGGGGQDKFRIRIWSDAGGLVYDNQLNAPDSADPTTVLGGGSIVIHKNGGNAALTAARVLHDFDGDGKSDVWSYRPDDGRWVVEYSGSHTLGAVRFGAADDLAVPADYDGDGRADVAVFTSATQRWQILLSSTSTVIDETFGRAGGEALPSDYDGDGKADLAVRTAQSEWQIRRSTDGESMTFKLGAPDKQGEQTVIGDFDGDGMTDASTYCARDGRWLIRFSRDGQQIERTTQIIHDAQIMAADFDGDGIDELAWWSVAQGELRFAGSSLDQQWQQMQTLSLIAKALLVGDYDGDGRADLLVMRPAANGSMRWEARLAKQHYQSTP